MLSIRALDSQFDNHQLLINSMERLSIETDREGICYGFTHIITDEITQGKLLSVLNSLTALECLTLESWGNLAELKLLQQYYHELISILAKISAAHSDQTQNFAQFSGIYQRHELKKYFSSLNKMAQCFRLTLPVAIILESGDHVIAITYLPDEKKWLAIEINNLPFFELKTANDFANFVLEAFESTETATFSTQVKLSNNDKKLTQKFLQYWQRTQDWKIIHAINPARTARVDSHGYSWLMIATKMNDLVTVKNLLAQKANPDQISRTGYASLHVAVKRNNLPVVKLLTEAGANINILLPYGVSAIYTAAEQNYLEIVQYLVANGAQLDFADTEDGCTALFCSVVREHEQIAVALIKAGANPVSYNADNEEIDAFAMAIELGLFKVIKALVKMNYPITKEYIALADDYNEFAIKRYLSKHIKVERNQTINFFMGSKQILSQASSIALENSSKI